MMQSTKMRFCRKKQNNKWANIGIKKMQKVREYEKRKKKKNLNDTN